MSAIEMNGLLKDDEIWRKRLGNLAEVKLGSAQP